MALSADNTVIITGVGEAAASGLLVNLAFPAQGLWRLLKPRR